MMESMEVFDGDIGVTMGLGRFLDNVDGGDCDPVMRGVEKVIRRLGVDGGVDHDGCMDWVRGRNVVDGGDVDP